MPALSPPMLAMTRPSSTSGEPRRAEVSLRHVEALHRVLAPDARARREIDRVELALARRTCRRRRRRRPAPRAVLRRSRSRRDRWWGRRSATIDAPVLASSDSSTSSLPTRWKRSTRPLDHDRARKRLADLLAPDDLRAGRSHVSEQWRPGVGAVAIRPRNCGQSVAMAGTAAASVITSSASHLRGMRQTLLQLRPAIASIAAI